MKKVLIYSLILCCFFSCKKEEEMEDVTQCIENDMEVYMSENDFSFVPDCSYIPDRFLDNYCEIEEGGYFPLSAEAQSYAPQYCEEIGHSFTYVSEFGDRMQLNLISKQIFSSSHVFLTDRKCEDNDLNKGICARIEYILFSLEESNSSFGLNFSLNINLRESEGEMILSERIRLNRFNNSIFLFNELYYIINTNSLSLYTSNNIEEYEEINLLGQDFTNVISNGISPFSLSRGFKYYYNQEIGLIAFEDEEGILWRLE